MPGWPGAGSCYPGPGLERGSDGVRGSGEGSAHWHGAFVQPWLPMPKSSACGIGMLHTFVPGDALGNLFLQVTSPGMCWQFGPSPDVTHMAVFKGTPARDTRQGSDAGMDAAGLQLRSPQLLRGVLGRAGCSPLPQNRGRDMHEGGLMPSVPKAGAVGDPCPSCHTSICIAWLLT